MTRWLSIGAMLLFLGLGVFRIALPYYPETAPAESFLQGNTGVEVLENNWLVFQPSEDDTSAPTLGFIIYPGARVSPRAYAPLAYNTAAAGFLAVIVPMPLHLAILGYDQAASVQEAFPNIAQWVIGGHSLGGAMAARYVREHGGMAALVLLAAYPGEGDDLSDWPQPVLSIAASEDGLADPAKIEARKALLPPQTEYIIIEGGNHAQFGSYGEQRGDGTALIRAEEQQDQILTHTLSLLQHLQSRD